MSAHPTIAGFDLCGAGGVDGEPEFIHIHIKAMGNAFVLGPGVEGFGLGDICGDAGITPEDDLFAKRCGWHLFQLLPHDADDKNEQRQRCPDRHIGRGQQRDIDESQEQDAGDETEQDFYKEFRFHIKFTS